MRACRAQPHANAFTDGCPRRALVARADAGIKRPPKPTPAKLPDELPVAAPDWEALPSGTRLRVWWEGSQEYFECTILNWRVAIGEDGTLFYTHRCMYENGVFDHDLANVDFEVIDVAHAWTFGEDDPDASDGEEEEEEEAEADGTSDEQTYGTNVDGVDELSPRRRWLAKQEAKLASYQVRVSLQLPPPACLPPSLLPDAFWPTRLRCLPPPHPPCPHPERSLAAGGCRRTSRTPT